MKKKTKGNLFDKDISEWGREDYLLFITLSATVQKQLPGCNTAGEATKLVAEHLDDFWARHDYAMSAQTSVHPLGINLANTTNFINLLLSDFVRNHQSEITNIPLVRIGNAAAWDCQIEFLHRDVLKILCPQQHFTLENSINPKSNNINNNVELNNFLYQKEKPIILPEAGLISVTLDPNIKEYMARNAKVDDKKEKDIKLNQGRNLTKLKMNVKPAILETLEPSSDGEPEDKIDI
jgi:hypothetical protein